MTRGTRRLPGGATLPGGAARSSWRRTSAALDHLLHADTPLSRVVIRLLWQVWLVFLGYPVSDVLTGHWPVAKAALAWVLLALFAALYVRVMWLAVEDPRGRRRSDLAAYAALMLIAAGADLGFGGNFGGLMIYSGVATGWVLRPGPALAGLVLVGGVTAAGLLVGEGGNVAFYAFLGVALGLSMIFLRATIAVMIELRAAREEVARLAVAEERLRFSRDLHDVLGHSLSVIALKSQVARRLLRRDPQAAEAALGDLETVAHDSLAALRDMVSGYRQRSLADELQSAEELLGSAGIAVRLSGAPLALPATSDSLLAWTVREGVTNVLRHSHAHRCDIAITTGGDGVSLEMTDDGRVGPPEKQRPGAAGSGLRGLRERMAEVGGSLEAGPRREGGFRLSVRLPAA